MSTDQTFARALHDLGGAAWFGGALMGAVGLDGASRAMPDPDDRIRVADAGWQAWRPWKLLAITVHVGGSLSLLWGNKARLAGQRGAMGVNLAKGAAMVAAFAADTYAVRLGREIAEEQSRVAVAGSATEPEEQVRDGVASKLRQLRIVQWSVPVLIGADIAISSKMGEQQRPSNVAGGFLERLVPRR